MFEKIEKKKCLHDQTPLSPAQCETTSQPILTNSETPKAAIYGFHIGPLLAFGEELLFVSCPHVFIGYQKMVEARGKVYPLFAAVGTAVGICAMQLVRNITTNPEVRVLKEHRAAGVLDNQKEGEKYAEHGLRKFVRKRVPQIMPSLNSFFSEPN
ncbi:hypothetical protein HPP92_021056 [Vanilla planifolia]|uniref:Uncharacterized protein n=1 Tax=Vanilla planifolia TaxID=51239 RepID=A0A835UJ26_VANPL|nr:hypothetical protein HPP92_021056 [Vanilla planifolia]